MLMQGCVKHRRLRAPDRDGQTLCLPPVAEVGRLLETNAQRAGRYDYDVQGRRLAELARSARQALVAAAVDYTSTYRPVTLPPRAAARAVVLGGHQPELFHPGVWFKNFVLGQIAGQHHALAINMLIDSDTISAASIRVPGGSTTAPTDNRVPFDEDVEELPFEERSIVDRSCFAGFGAEAGRILAPLVRQPILDEFWPLAVRRAGANANLGQCLAQARHQLEQTWGLETLEVLQSATCRFEAFHWFTAHLLAQLPRFWQCYNQSLEDYRRRRRIRSHMHPVSDLGRRGPWLEAPFWIWTRADPRRRRLWVEHRPGQVALSDGRSWEKVLPLAADADGRRACAELAEWADRGIKIRTRAALTTLFARLFLCDVFVHGTGGANYDQLTDQLMRQFFGLEPPAYCVATATLHLPVARRKIAPDEDRRLRRTLRDLVYNPDRHIDLATIGDAGQRQQARRIMASKRAAIDRSQPDQTAAERHRAITSANAALQPWVTRKRTELLEALRHASAALEAEAILASRQYAFCLHPRTALESLLRGRPASHRPEPASPHPR